MKTAKLLKPLTPVQFLAANVVVSFLVLVFFFTNAFVTPKVFLLSFLWALIICSTQWVGPLLINYLLDKKIKWMERPVRRSITEIISLLTWSVSAFIIVQVVMYWLVLGLTPEQSWSRISAGLIITISVSSFIALFFTSIGFFKAWRRSVLKEAELQSQMLTYKYESLRNQLNPHFLFNSLNVLSDLIYSDQEQAVKFVQQLSGLFHYVLDSRDKELVTLKEEVDFLQSYIFLLNTRFGDKLKIQVNIDEKAKCYIVPMSLQLLVENAVKHNEVSERHPLKVFITSENGYLRVENVKQPKVAGEISKNTGLKNINQQYNFLTEKEIEVVETGSTFTVKIPLIKTIENEGTNH
ncbi:MAG TPA: histidine kinase [Lentimicrobium sp.]|nr:histidine kinase [Lentimicrobium sp.]